MGAPQPSALTVAPPPEVFESAVEEYVRDCADKLGLRDWAFECRWREVPQDPQALASCTPIEGRRYAVLRFHQDFGVLPPAEIRHAVAHELVHAHFAAMCDHVRRSVQPWMPVRTFEMFWDETVLDLEPAVDALAAVLVERLPLIVWG